MKIWWFTSIDFNVIFFYAIKIYNDFNTTFVGNTCLDIINVKMSFNYNGEMFCKPRIFALLTFNFIQPWGEQISLNISINNVINVMM